MPATGERIQFVTQAVRRAKAETPSVRARHGSLAREHSEPVETFFVNVADAQLMAEARQDLFSPERRVFTVSAVGLDEVMELDLAGKRIPNMQVVDSERAVDRLTMTGAVTIDFAKQSVDFEQWG